MFFDSEYIFDSDISNSFGKLIFLLQHVNDINTNEPIIIKIIPITE